MSDPQPFSSRELRRRMSNLDPQARRRIQRAVRRGERVGSVDEARLAVSLAIANRKALPLFGLLFLLLGGLRIQWIARNGFGVLDGVVFAAIAVVLGKLALWDRPRLQRAERLNRQMLHDAT